MTELVEKMTIEITLNHDAKDVASRLYFGPTDLNQALDDIWPKLRPWLKGPKGQAKFAFGGIEVMWTYLGLEERAETGGGDN